jgi:outer membrane protein X
MKKITFSILLLSAVAVVNAQQQFKPFKVDLSTGYAIPSGKGAKGGVLFVVEPKYAVIPNFSAGLRIEVAIMARGTADDAGNLSSVDVKAAGSYLATGDYYLTSNTVRPFVGAGVGIFSLASASADGTTGSAGAGSKFGEMVRAGVEISHFRLGLEYNIVPSTDVSVYDANSGETTTGKAKNSYIGIKIGAVIGGGRIK